MTDKTPAHLVDVVPVPERKGLFQATCTCGWLGDVEFRSRALIASAAHSVAQTYPQAFPQAEQ